MDQLINSQHDKHNRLSTLPKQTKHFHRNLNSKILNTELFVILSLSGLFPTQEKHFCHHWLSFLSFDRFFVRSSYFCCFKSQKKKINDGKVSVSVLYTLVSTYTELKSQHWHWLNGEIYTRTQAFTFLLPLNVILPVLRHRTRKKCHERWELQSAVMQIIGFRPSYATLSPAVMRPGCHYTGF